MDWKTLIAFVNHGLEAIVMSLISTIVFTINISFMNSIKVYRRIKKIKPQFETTKKHFKELCDDSFIITMKCIKSYYTIADNCRGCYRSLISELESQKNQLIKLSKYSFVRGKSLDGIIDAISTYEFIIYKLSIISVTEFDGKEITYSDTYKDDATNEIDKLNKFFKLTEVN